MKVLVTGASGHVGGNLVRALLARGDQVRVTVHGDERALAGLPVERVAADTRDARQVRAAVDGVEVVFHAAAIISIDGGRGGVVEATNVAGPRNVAEACLDAGVRRLVHVSSIHALSQRPLDTHIDEARPWAFEADRGMPAYDASKGRGEREVLGVVKRGLDATIVNPGGIIGPFDFKPSRMGRVILDVALRKLPALVPGGFIWVDVRDVVAGLLAAAEHGRTGERYLLTGEWAPVKQVAAFVHEATGVKLPGTSPMWAARMGAPFFQAWGRLRRREPLYTGESLRALRWNPAVSHDKAARELGFAPRPLRDTVVDSVAWFREAEMLGAQG
jgi:dihydroflavonol-4-reductase